MDDLFTEMHDFCGDPIGPAIDEAWNMHDLDDAEYENHPGIVAVWARMDELKPVLLAELEPALNKRRETRAAMEDVLCRLEGVDAQLARIERVEAA